MCSQDHRDGTCNDHHCCKGGEQFSTSGVNTGTGDDTDWITYFLPEGHGDLESTIHTDRQENSQTEVSVKPMGRAQRLQGNASTIGISINENQGAVDTDDSQFGEEEDRENLS